MRIVHFDRDQSKPIEVFHATGAANVHIGSGRGESHIEALYVGAGGQVGPLTADAPHLFLVVEGRGWVAGPDGARKALTAGQGAYLGPDEVHSAGTDAGMTVVIVAAERLEPASWAPAW